MTLGPMNCQSGGTMRIDVGSLDKDGTGGTWEHYSQIALHIGESLTVNVLYKAWPFEPDNPQKRAIVSPNRISIYSGSSIQGNPLGSFTSGNHYQPVLESGLQVYLIKHNGSSCMQIIDTEYLSEESPEKTYSFSFEVKIHFDSGPEYRTLDPVMINKPGVGTLSRGGATSAQLVDPAGGSAAGAVKSHRRSAAR